ncbi:MAG: HAMP domain-containing histidine kinase [Caldilineaceae bacterium]|nr:HAMP domain-containing histidine kinase [Caldilineaceae bacterium]
MIENLAPSLASPKQPPIDHQFNKVFDKARGGILIQAPGDRYLRHVNILRFLLPVLLFVVANGFEIYEHWTEITLLNLQLLGEVLFFGVLGPILVFTWVSYVGVLLQKLNLANKQMAALNQGLEKQVAERTAMLALRNEELACANAELAGMNNDLKKLDQMKSDFVALVSHELRAPLTNLNGAIEMTLQSQHELSEQSRRVLQVMASESARLTDFVRTILDLSRLEAGKIKFNPGPIAVKPMLARSVASSLGHTERPVIWHMEAQTPPVWADEIYVEEIVRNILVNAEKYTPSDSPVKISVSTSTARPGFVQIAVTDHGPGIAAEAQAHIFDRFYRIKSEDGGVIPGWGLGLYFAHTLTEAQGGCLTLTSPVHDDAHFPGACFTITLPVAQETPEHD